MSDVVLIPSLGFTRGAVVRHREAGNNLLVVRQLETTTAVLSIEGDSGGTIRLREYPTASLRQLLPSAIAPRGADAVGEPSAAPLKPMENAFPSDEWVDPDAYFNFIAHVQPPPQLDLFPPGETP